LVRLQPERIEISDSGSADSLVTITHGLGRVPLGFRVVDRELTSGGDATEYRLDTDSDWTTREMYLRFRPANSRVLLEVF